MDPHKGAGGGGSNPQTHKYTKALDQLRFFSALFTVAVISSLHRRNRGQCAPEFIDVYVKITVRNEAVGLWRLQAVQKVR